jgi:hypothetical protein
LSCAFGSAIPRVGGTAAAMPRADKMEPKRIAKILRVEVEFI